MHRSRARILRLLVGLALLFALLVIVRMNRRSPGSGPGTLTSEFKELGVDPVAVARQLQDLERKEANVDATTWAKEQVADEASRTIEALWNSLNRGTNCWHVLGALTPSNVVLPVFGRTNGLPSGVEQRIAGETGQALAGPELEVRLKEWAASGWRITQSELRHVGFDLNAGGRPGRSRIDLRLHFVRDGSAERAALRGEIEVGWGESTGAPGALRWETIDAHRLEWIVRRSVPPFEEVFKEDLLPTEGSYFIDPLIVYDLDGDGFSEIILAARNRIYRRGSDGRITGTQLLPIDPPLIHSALVADFDGDGHADFLHASFEGLFLSTGNGNGRFQSPGKSVWRAEPRLKYVQAMTCGDIDGDSDLDLWLAQYKVPYERGQMPTPFDDANDGFPSHLLLNDGRGGFEDVTAAAGLAEKSHRRVYSASFADLDGDLDLDLVLVSDFAGGDLFANDGKGRFQDRTAAWVPAPKAFGMAQVVSDVDRDGRSDLLMIGMNSPTADRLNSLGLHRSSVDEIARRNQVAHGNRLWVARPEGGFTSSPLEAAIARTGWSWGAAAADFDNNGYPDLYVANGHETRQSVRDYEREFWMHDIYVGTSADSLLASTYFISKSSRTRGQGDSYGGWEKNRLYLRDTAAGLVEVGHLMGVAIGEDCRNVVGTDLDADGKVDLLVTTFEVWPQRRQRFHVFRNKLDEGQNWIGFQFREKPGRPSAAGAIVRLHANNYGTVGQWIAGDSYRSQNNGPMHFGLGKTSAVETVEIRWPDGRVVSMKSPAINRYHPIEP